MINLKELTPAALIRLAIYDVRASLKQGIKLNMDVWVQPKSEISEITPFDNICSVCFAGSIMVQHQDEGSLYRMHDNIIAQFDAEFSHYKNEYWALDKIRNGDINSFFYKLGYKLKQVKPIEKDKGLVLHKDREGYSLFNFIPHNNENTEEFLTQMEKVADMIEEILPEFTKI